MIVVPNAVFQWTAGQENIAKWTKPGGDWESWFCKTCGARVPGHNDPSTMFIPAGTLDDSSELKVIHHIWVGSKASWDVIGDSGKQHLEAFSG